MSGLQISAETKPMMKYVSFDPIRFDNFGKAPSATRTPSGILGWTDRYTEQTVKTAGASSPRFHGPKILTQGLAASSLTAGNAAGAALIVGGLAAFALGSPQIGILMVAVGIAACGGSKRNCPETCADDLCHKTQVDGQDVIECGCAPGKQETICIINARIEGECQEIGSYLCCRADGELYQSGSCVYGM